MSYVVLRPDLDVVLARATSREGRHLREIEPIKGLYGAFATHEGLERHVVDSSAESPEQTAEAVRAGLREGHFVLAPGA